MPHIANPRARSAARPCVLASAIDRNYVIPYAAMLSSLRDHNPAAEICAYLIHYDLLEDDRRFLEAVSKRAGIALTLVSIPGYPFLSFGTRRRRHLGREKHMPQIAYAKAFLDRFLPVDVDRVICIDGDVIVNGDMAEIFDMQVDAPVTATANIARLHAHQFNSGFMLLDLGAWRRLGVADIAEAFLLRYSDALHSHDQHLLNLIFRDQWTMIDLKWNYIEDHYRRRTEHPVYSEADIIAARNNPIIVHYAVGCDKPWNPHCQHPRVDLYRKYRAGLESLMAGFNLADLQRRWRPDDA